MLKQRANLVSSQKVQQTYVAAVVVAAAAAAVGDGSIPSTNIEQDANNETRSIDLHVAK